MTHGLEADETETPKEGADLQTMTTQLNYQCLTEQAGPRKKRKASKLSINPITLTKGDLYDIDETMHNATFEVLEELR